MTNQLSTAQNKLLFQHDLKIKSACYQKWKILKKLYANIQQ